MVKQLLFTLSGLILVTLLFFFGRTVAPKKTNGTPVAPEVKAFDISQFIEKEKKRLTVSQAAAIGKLENSLIREDVLNQRATSYMQLADFWKDSIHSVDPYIYYLSESSKLDKSEKNLTFAARLILDNLRIEQDEAKLKWKSDLAIDLFERALELSPDNDDLKIGLGSCYIFGKGRSGNPQETMKGIQQLLSVVRKDSNNMKAQMMLGVGGYISRQYDKAVERLQKVVKAQPDNMEAVAFLADTYAAKGDKQEAIKWYLVSKRMVNDPHYSQEVDERIRQLR